MMEQHRTRLCLADKAVDRRLLQESGGAEGRGPERVGASVWRVGEA